MLNFDSCYFECWAKNCYFCDICHNGFTKIKLIVAEKALKQVFIFKRAVHMRKLHKINLEETV